LGWKSKEEQSGHGGGQKADVEETIAEIDDRNGRGTKDPMHFSLE
jgi:hypothetical protein